MDKKSSSNSQFGPRPRASTLKIPLIPLKCDNPHARFFSYLFLYFIKFRAAPGFHFFNLVIFFRKLLTLLIILSRCKNHDTCDSFAKRNLIKSLRWKMIFRKRGRLSANFRFRSFGIKFPFLSGEKLVFVFGILIA